MIRPEVVASLLRWREVIAATLVAALGLWLASLGGLVLIPFGLAVAGLGAGLGLHGWRRLRFAGAGDAPGLVEVNEGQIAYLSATGGGFVSLRELAELRLVSRAGQRFWHLRQGDGTALAIPLGATGAEALFDALSTLPGLDSGALVAALAPSEPGAGGMPVAGALSRLVWQRPARRIGRG